MRKSPVLGVVVLCVFSAALAVAACGGSDAAPPSVSNGDAGARGFEPAGQACTSAAQCYTELDAGAVVGAVTCLAKVPNGYCTHACTVDSACCAVPGECKTGITQVCSPFENDFTKYCFLGCEDSDVQKAVAANPGVLDGGVADAAVSADAYCQSFAGPATSCRSSGGGSKNRKVCVPKS